MMLWMLVSLGWASVEKMPPAQKKEDACSVPPTQTEMFVLAKEYYEQSGLWAGVFFLSRAQKQRVVQQGEKDFAYHLQYLYTPVPQNPMGRDDSGYDQRIFIIRCEKWWYVENMREHMSASFP